VHYLYILHSDSLNKYYVGETHNIDKRLQMHMEHAYKNAFSNSADDWKIVLLYKCNSRCDALFLEKFIKRMKSKVFILKIVKNPDILADILSKK